MKKLFIVVWFICFAISAVELLGDDIQNSITNSPPPRESVKETKEEYIIEQSNSQIIHPVAIPILSPEEAVKANKDALIFHSIRRIRIITVNILLAVIPVFCFIIMIVPAHFGKIRQLMNPQEENMVIDQKANAKKRMLFLDVLKGLAIIAVICDHSICWSKLCPLSFLPIKTTFYSVSLFVLCAGYTSAMSLERARTNNVSTHAWITKKITHILCYYFIATAFYLFIKTPSHIINFSSFVDAAIRFNASPPLYFILFFIQLLCIAPLTFSVFSGKNTKPIYKTAFYILIIYMSYFCVDYTKIGKLHGGGRHLFGGTYLMIYVLGQIIYIYRNWLLSRKVSAIAMGGFVLILYLLSMPVFSTSNFVITGNPPGLFCIAYAISLFFAITFLFSIKFFSRIQTTILYPISFFGKHSFEIFLYHAAVLNLLNNYIRYNNGASGGQIVYANMQEPNLFIKSAIVLPNTPAMHILVGGIAFISYLLIPSCGAILYRCLKRKYKSFSKGEENAIS